MPRARTRSRRLRSWSSFSDERVGRVWRGSHSSVIEALWWPNALIPYIYFIMDICRYKSGVLVQIGCALQYTFVLPARALVRED